MLSKAIIPSPSPTPAAITRAMRKFSGTTLPERTLAVNNEAIRKVKICNYYWTPLDSSWNRSIIREKETTPCVRYCRTVQQYKGSRKNTTPFKTSIIPHLKMLGRAVLAPAADLMVVVAVIADSHIQRIVLGTEDTTVTQQVSHRPIKCQSRSWSQRGMKVNGSHHGDNPLLRPTGIQIATKNYAALQAMAPTNVKTVHHSLLHNIESNLDRLEMLSPIHGQRSQQQSGQITLQLVIINKPKFFRATYRTEIKKIEILRSMVVDDLS